MKIIDPQGRLLGKINVIDFLALVFLLSLTPMFYFGYKIFNKKPPAAPAPAVEAAPKKFIDTEIAFIFTKLEPKTLELIAAGDKETDEKGNVIAEILLVGKPNPLVYAIDVGNGQKLNQEDALFKELPVTLRMKAELRDNNLYYKDKAIKANSAIDFNCGKYKAEALFITPASPEENTKIQNEIKGIILPALERRITDLHLEISNLKGKIETMEMFLKQRDPSHAQVVEEAAIEEPKQKPEAKAKTLKE